MDEDAEAAVFNHVKSILAPLAAAYPHTVIYRSEIVPNFQSLNSVYAISQAVEPIFLRLCDSIQREGYLLVSQGMWQSEGQYELYVKGMACAPTNIKEDRENM